MAREPRLGPARPGQKRPRSTAILGSSGHCDLDYKLYAEDVPYRVYENQRIPPLINHVPVRIRRTHAGMGVKGSFGPHKAPKNGPLPPRRIQPPTGELHSIREELSQIKAQVDSLLESLERMDPQRHQAAGTMDSEETKGPGSESAWCRSTENQWEPRGQRAGAQMDSAKAGTSTEQAVKSYTSDQEGSE
ncbi:RNA-binding Raly-like protein [Lepus europaeus]|uniref:RNA-binding Raly-like protein n=1 Tax=Lepus europaeus TaxID=9983 RepID=UPI002B47B29D|nr:RNA-binding Raly-like protein [Lepus europaeus]